MSTDVKVEMVERVVLKLNNGTFVCIEGSSAQEMMGYVLDRFDIKFIPTERVK